MNDDRHKPIEAGTTSDHVVHRHTVVFDLSQGELPTFSVGVELRYSTRDPYAITLSFCYGRENCVEWVFARDLLVAGLWEKVGEGDIRIRPSVTRPGFVRVELESPSGYATFYCGLDDLKNFLDCTHVIVPLGTEGRWLDFEREFTRLFPDHY
jgi:hypothetical protein